MSFTIHSSTRREFLRATSIAVAGTVLGTQALQARQPVLIPADSGRSPADFLTSLPEPELHALATRAIDIAKSSGAVYADVRIAEQHRLQASLQGISLQTNFTFGVRALIGGVWGFAYGCAPTVDAITRCAKDAVSAGRVSANLTGISIQGPEEDWVPAPVATGEWRMSVNVDPFTISAQEQAELAAAVRWTIEQVPGGGGGISPEWTKETRVFAATTGSLVTQYRYSADPRSSAGVRYGTNRVSVRVHGINAKPAGYEILLIPDLQDRFKAATEAAVELARLPMRPMDVGRYPVVFDGYVMGNLLTNVVGPSAELDRVLGYDVDASGTSRWSMDLLGTPVASPYMTVVGHRSVPEAINAVQWDDEGTVPQEHTTIKDGLLVDYHTNGQTASVLRSWYDRQGRKPPHSNGCAMSVTADKVVSVRPPHLTMKPGKTPVSLEDLYKDVNKGILVTMQGIMRTDQQLTSASINSWDMVFQISRGKIVRRLKDMGLQFNTVPFLKGLMHVGDHNTVRYQNSSLNKGMPWQSTRQSSTAPAGLFKEINVISTGRS